MGFDTELLELMNKDAFIHIILKPGMYQTRCVDAAQHVYKYLTCVYNLKVGCGVACTNMLKVNLLFGVINFTTFNVYRKYENEVHYEGAEIIKFVAS